MTFVTGLTLLDRRIYVMTDVDLFLGLASGTARRWIDGYQRAGRTYPPVIRPERTDDESVSWGEFVETRLLANYRAKGLSLQRLRPAVQQLRVEFRSPYPLAIAQPFVDVQGRELVRQIQEDTGLDAALRFVVIRSGQLVLAAPTQDFTDHAVFAADGAIEALRTDVDTPDVRIDPLRQTGQPVVRSVPTAVLAEAFRRRKRARSRQTARAGAPRCRLSGSVDATQSDHCPGPSPYHVPVRLNSDRVCTLVIIGVRADGKQGWSSWPMALRVHAVACARHLQGTQRSAGKVTTGTAAIGLRPPRRPVSVARALREPAPPDARRCAQCRGGSVGGRRHRWPR